MEELKKTAGVTAAKFVKDGMVVGLGTGSTAYFFVEEIGRRIKEEGLNVVGVTTSSQTTKQAEGLGIPLKAVDDIDSIDVTVDGADDYIIDLDLGKIENPVALGEELKAMTGVVEHGLFNGMVNKVIVAGKDGVKIVEVKA